MTYSNKALYETAISLLDDWELDVEQIALLAQNLGEEAAAIMEERNEAAYMRHQESLMESGGNDETYRKHMKDAGRGHLLKG